MFHRILAALDDSEFSQVVFEQALAVAKDNQAKLMLLHVLEPFDDYPSDPYMGRLESARQAHWKHWKEWEQAGIDRLRLLEESAMDSAGVATEFTQSLGSPGKAICALARTWNADLIIVGRRGVKGIQEFLMGSVSNYVLHHASCNVLTLQGKLEKAENEITESIDSVISC